MWTLTVVSAIAIRCLRSTFMALPVDRNSASSLNVGGRQPSCAYCEAHIRVADQLYQLRELGRAERERLSLEPHVYAAIHALIHSPLWRLRECSRGGVID